MHDTNSRPFRNVIGPTLVVGLVAALPLLAAPAAQAATTGNRAAVVTSSQDKASAIVRCVSEAARHLVSANVSFVHEDTRGFDVAPIVSFQSPAAPSDRPVPHVFTRPALIDLPPPLR
ncbi:MAG: hypothetical protein GC162_02415 [Planctomycetes bacterium]|nr:hypothetical protein [Planctomycetota bacterium]